MANIFGEWRKWVKNKGIIEEGSCLVSKWSSANIKFIKNEMDKIYPWINGD